jgi:RNA polymerase sigma-70 factor (ECF subfamily)
MGNVRPRSESSTLDVGSLFDEHFDYLWGTLRRLGVRTADLEDLVHEVFIKIYMRRDDYDETRPVRPWLFGFAYRLAADYRRLARHRFEVLDVPMNAADSEAQADERVAANDERALVHAALECVEFDRRAVLVLHDLDEIPIPQIAVALGVPLNTAYSRLRLARSEFAAAARRLRIARGSL